MGGNYTFLDAAYKSSQTVDGGGNSVNDRGGLGGVGQSFARGNENNLGRPGGIRYLRPGFSPGYGMVNLAAHYGVQLFLQINNLLNHRYYTAAQLGSSPFDSVGNFIARPLGQKSDGDFPIRCSTFFVPGAPIGIWGGIRFAF
jgi:outer membrane receptor protein involved in Fe transport